MSGCEYGYFKRGCKRIYNQAAMLVFGSKRRERQKEIEDYYKPLDEGEPFEPERK